MNSQLAISIHQTISLHVSNVVDKSRPYPINCRAMLSSKNVQTTTSPWLLTSPLRSSVHLFPIRSSLFLFLYPFPLPSSFSFFLPHFSSSLFNTPLRLSFSRSDHHLFSSFIIFTLRTSFLLSIQPFHSSTIIRPLCSFFRSSSSVIIFPLAYQSSCFIILLKFFSSSIISPLRTQGGRSSGEISPKHPHRGESFPS